MDQSIFLKPPDFEPPVWRPEVPLLVIVRCTSVTAADLGEDNDDTPRAQRRQRRPANPASLVFTWLAFRWFSAAYPKQRKYSTRRIAAWMGADRHSVVRWAAILATLGLLVYEGDDDDNSFEAPQAVYSIPLRSIEQESGRICLEMVLKWQAGPDEPENPPKEQLALDLPHTDAEKNSPHGRNYTHGHGGNYAHSMGAITGGHGGNYAHGMGAITGGHGGNYAHGMGAIAPDRMDGSNLRMDGSAPALKKRARGRPPKVPPPPSAELFAAHPKWAMRGALASHPWELWQRACANPLPSHKDQLLALAAEHDGPTDGHGLYWVGQAINAGLNAQEQLRTPAYLRNTMQRWQGEDSYGSDLPRSAQERPNGRRPTPTGPAGRGRSRGVVAQPRPQPHRPEPPADRPAAAGAEPVPGDFDAELAAAEQWAEEQKRRRRETRA